MAKSDMSTVVMAVGLVGALLVLGVIALTPGAPTEGGGGGTTVYTDVGGTLSFEWKDLQSDSETTVYPNAVTLIDETGTKEINDAAANSTTVNKGETYDLYNTGTDYYCNPLMGISLPLTKETDTVEGVCNTPATDSTIELKIYDEDEVSELTADDNASNEADYSLSLADDQEYNVYIEVKNADSDSTVWIGALCTFAMNDIDEFEITDSGWEEIDMPDEVDDAAIAIADDTATDRSGDWDHCYKPVGADYLELEQFKKSGKIEALVTAGDTNPATNTGDNFGVILLDYSYNVDKNGDIIEGIHDGSEDEDVGNMGPIDEGAELISPFGKDICASVEAL